MSDPIVIFVAACQRRQASLKSNPGQIVLNVCVRYLARGAVFDLVGLGSCISTSKRLVKKKTVFQVLNNVFGKARLRLLNVAVISVRVGDALVSQVQRCFSFVSPALHPVPAAVSRQLWHISTSSLFCIRVKGIMALFPLATLSYAVTLANWWPAISARVCFSMSLCMWEYEFEETGFFHQSSCHWDFKRRCTFHNMT